MNSLNIAASGVNRLMDSVRDVWRDRAIDK